MSPADPSSPDGAPRSVEQALVESEQRFRTLASLTTEGILIHDRGHILEVNQRFIDLIGRQSPADLIGTDGVEGIGFTEESKQRVLEAIRTNPSDAYRVDVVRPDGTMLNAETRGGAITYLGRPARIVYMWDVGDRLRAEAERTRLEESLRQAQKLESVGRLAGGIAHDFNNLLTVIGGNVALAVIGLAPDDERLDLLGEAERAVQSAANLTRQLLTFSRKQVIAPQVVNINTAVGELDKMLRRLIGEDIELQTTLDPALGQTMVDVGHLEQILVNLVVNARDAMPDGGKLTVETANVTLDEEYCKTRVEARPGRYVMLAVTDEGTGMTEEVRAHIFEPFFTTKASGRGTGLGLPMVYGAVKQHGGHLAVYSEPGRGATFKIYLPRVEEAAQARHEAPDSPPRGKETIVLVEDADALRALAVRLLKRQGYAVHAFPNGQAALDALPGLPGPVDLLLTDVVLPGMSGRMLAERMSALRPGLRVLFTSGYTENVVVHHGVLKKGLHFLPKPYTIDTLAARVREVLDGAG
jgi:PAS domain S-box-containing protein